MSTQKRLFTAMTPSFCSLTDTKQSLQYTIKTHLSGPPMPKFEANMNYVPPSPPSSMKQCNKSATVKFHMELLLTTTTRKQSRSGATPIEVASVDKIIRGNIIYICNSFHLLVLNMGKYLPQYGKVCEDNKCLTALVILAVLSLLLQIFPYINHKLMKLTLSTS